MTSFCYPQTVNLEENAGFQNVIIDVIPSENMIWMDSDVKVWGQRIHGPNIVVPPGNQAVEEEDKPLFLKSLGGIPVNRGASQGVVEQMVEIFNTRNEFLLAIVPEGTRKKVTTIKTGFRHIAKAAKVSVICWYPDNENKTARWLAEIIPGEDKIEDLIRIRDIYEKAGYRFPLDVTLSSPENSSRS